MTTFLVKTGDGPDHVGAPADHVAADAPRAAEHILRLHAGRPPHA
jgi:hypothetical protein